MWLFQRKKITDPFREIRKNKESSRMKKMIGFIAFWIAVGMLFMLFLAHHYLIALIIIGLLLLVGYNFYCD